MRTKNFQSVKGSRSGGNIACAWGVMNLLGREGYVERAKRVIGSAHKLRDAARNIHGIEVVGNPQEHADTLFFKLALVESYFRK